MNLRETTRALVGGLLDGTITGEAAVAQLSAIELEQLLPSQLAGAVDAVMERAAPFPTFPDALDCCGTGGDGLHSLNISSAAAIVAASCGLQIAKHGNRAVTSASGSADVLEALGVATGLTPEQSARVLSETGIAFLFAPTFHPGFARVAPIRKAIGKRTLFNLLGPLCNPARVERQLIGVFAAPFCALLAETSHLLGRKQVMVVHGEDGSDELSISGSSHVAELKDGKVSYVAIRPQDAGLKPHPVAALRGSSAANNADALRDVLCGKSNAYADAVILNTAAVLVLAGKAGAIYDGAIMARNAIALGKATRKLDELIEATHSV